jgi:hypothetical protein
MCTFEQGPLSDRVLTGVREALADEWQAEARYDAFSKKFTQPFPRLEGAEERHADVLVKLLEAHGQAAPTRPSATSEDAADARGACGIALGAERANVAMYDRLIADGPPADVKCVYEHLRGMSAERHIPALERCAAAP